MFTTATIVSLLLMLLKLVIIVIVLILFNYITSGIKWIIRTFLLVPRAYFYIYNCGDKWYSDIIKKILWFHKVGRNIKPNIRTSLLGYVSKPIYYSNEDAPANDIYILANFSKERVGQVKFIDSKGQVILRMFNSQGDEFNNNPPVGYIDEYGKIYKYYDNREDWIKGKKLSEAEFIGQCEIPTVYKKHYAATQGEKNDEDVLDYIPGSEYESQEKKEQGKDRANDTTWYSFRKNYSSSKKVKYIEIKGSGAVREGEKRWFNAWCWRSFDVFTKGWDRKMEAFGFGFCKKNFGWWFFNEEEQQIRLIQRAAAALLLIKLSGFLDYEDEKPRGDSKGFAATAILSLLIYYLSFRFLWLGIASIWLWFPFLGPILSTTLALTVLFFIIWIIVHSIRMLLFELNPTFERFLDMLNKNVGVKTYSTLIIVFSLIGLILSLFTLSYPYFALLFSTIVAFAINSVAYKQKKWPVQNPYESKTKTEDSGDSTFFESDNVKIREYKWNLNTAFINKTFSFNSPFSLPDINKLRLSNPYRIGNYFGKYSDIVKKMIIDEVTVFQNISKIKEFSNKFNEYARKFGICYIDKIQMILSFVQEKNIRYIYDTDSPELMPSETELSSLKQSLFEKNKNGSLGYIEYCRFPTESLFDQRGDCDCKSALAAALISASGHSVSYFVGKTDTGSHAAIGIECSKGLESFLESNNYATIDGRKFIYCETTGEGWKIGSIPAGHDNMLKDEQVIIEAFI